jgi:hypothetical protein
MMKKPTKLLLFMFISALFLGILYWNGSGGTTILPPRPGVTTIDQLNKKIDSLGKNQYLDNFYEQIKLDIYGMHSAQELSDEVKDGLIGSLEIAKMESLVLSFDQLKNSDCMNVVGLSKWSNLLKNQCQIIPYPKAQECIAKYRNLSAFLGKRNLVNAFLAGEFNNVYYNNLKSRIEQLSGSAGVSDCSSCIVIKKNLLVQLNDFQGAYNNFIGIQNGSLPCFPGYKDNFEKYLYYYNNFKCPQ